jgi:hypothetical protein
MPDGTSLIDQISHLSSVSGGSIAAAYYMYLVYRHRLGGDPSEMLLTQPSLDTPTLALPKPASRRDGAISMRFTGMVGERYQVLTSTDLETWELWKEFTAIADVFDIIDPDSVSTPQRFFRVVEP